MRKAGELMTARWRSRAVWKAAPETSALRSRELVNENQTFDALDVSAPTPIARST